MIPACASISPSQDQLKFSEMVVRDFGYDFQRGRMDLTHHPFETTFSIGDVRITTRVKENDLGECMFSVMHEAGHAMYEQGCNPDYEARPLQGGTSAGVHESQSRTWENLVGRSREFWEFYYPKLQADLPRAARQRRPGHVLPGDQQGPAFADPHRRRRGDLQPAPADPLRAGAGAAGRHAGSQRPARSLECTLPAVPGHHPAG